MLQHRNMWALLTVLTVGGAFTAPTQAAPTQTVIDVIAQEIAQTVGRPASSVAMTVVDGVREMQDAMHGPSKAVARNAAIVLRSPAGFIPFVAPLNLVGGVVMAAFEAYALGEEVGHQLNPVDCISCGEETFRYKPEGGTYGSIWHPPLEVFPYDELPSSWRTTYIAPGTHGWKGIRISRGSTGASANWYVPGLNNGFPYITDMPSPTNGYNTTIGYTSGGAVTTGEWVPLVLSRYELWAITQPYTGHGGTVNHGWYPYHVGTFTPKDVTSQAVRDDAVANLSEDQIAKYLVPGGHGLGVAPQLPSQLPAPGTNVFYETTNNTIVFGPLPAPEVDDGVKDEGASPAPSSSPGSTPSPSPTPRSYTHTNTTIRETVDNGDGTTTTTETTTGTVPTGTSFVEHFVAVSQTKFPFDWYVDAEINASDAPLGYTAFEGKAYAGTSVEKFHDLNWMKPYLNAIVGAGMIGFTILAIMWI